jgi:hypothetical protein
LHLGQRYLILEKQRSGLDGTSWHIQWQQASQDHDSIGS